MEQTRHGDNEAKNELMSSDDAMPKAAVQKKTNELSRKTRNRRMSDGTQTNAKKTQTDHRTTGTHGERERNEAGDGPRIEIRSLLRVILFLRAVATG